MTTQRCTPTERAAFRRVSGMEPALGTLDERLTIILRRQGVAQRIVLTRAERAELESYRVA